MRGRMLLAVVAGGLLLTGCVPGLTDGGRAEALVAEVRGIQGGECYGATSGQQLDFEQRVPCTQEHEFEVLAAVPVPAEMGEVALSDALDKEGAVNAALMAHVLPLCAEELAGVTGLAQTVSVVPQLQTANLWPGMTGSITAHIPPEMVWREYPVLICAYEWADEAGDVVSVTAPTDAPLVASYGTRDGGDPVRMCLELTKGYMAVPCTQVHDAEVLFEFDAQLALGVEWVAGVDIAAMRDDQWAALDGLCTAVAPAVFDAERTQTDVVVMAEVFPELWGFDGGTGTVTYPVDCVAYSGVTGMRLAGPVWGIGDEPATLAPAS